MAIGQHEGHDPGSLALSEASGIVAEVRESAARLEHALNNSLAALHSKVRGELEVQKDATEKLFTLFGALIATEAESDTWSCSEGGAGVDEHTSGGVRRMIVPGKSGCTRGKDFGVAPFRQSCLDVKVLAVPENGPCICELEKGGFVHADPGQDGHSIRFSDRDAQSRFAQQDQASGQKEERLLVGGAPTGEWGGPGAEEGPRRSEWLKVSMMSQVPKSISSQWSRITDTTQPEPEPTALGGLVRSWLFESSCAVVIFLNCVVMGAQVHLEISRSLDGPEDVFFQVMEHFFTLFFLLEFILRLKVFGWRAFAPITIDGRWNFLDAVLVLITGVLVTWIVPLVASVVGFDTNSAVFRVLQVLRAVRLARLVRVFRRIRLFREAWLLIRGLNDSGRTLLWTVIVIFFVTYAFAIFGIVIILPPLQERQREHAGDWESGRLDEAVSVLNGLDKFMYTLVQVLVGDSFHSLMRVILVYVPLSWVFFYSYIAIAVLVLMNLVTAIIVENAMETSKSDQEQQIQDKTSTQKKLLKELSYLFQLMDSDESGTLSWEEFRNSFEDDKMRKHWMLLDFKPDECHELFRLLDDGDGEIQTSEFFEGLSRMRGPAQAKDVYRLQKSVYKLQNLLREHEHFSVVNSIGSTTA